MAEAKAARIMAHLVAGYPDRAGALAAALGLAEGGASLLEVQFPFSDPTADGPLIQEACDAALTGGFRVAAGFELVRRIRAETGLPVFIMSYAGLVVARGVPGTGAAGGGPGPDRAGPARRLRRGAVRPRARVGPGDRAGGRS
jgi:tryptophan synthase alpha subunit